MSAARTVEYDGVTYAKGAKFRVIREGARLSGLVAMPAWQQGWDQKLNVGDVIECCGYGPGWGSDPGYGINWTSDMAREAGAHSLDFRPFEGGVFGYHPAPGYLEEVV